MKIAASLLLLLMMTVTLSAQTSTQPPIELPQALDRVLRDYEKFWRAKDADGLAALFTEDGFVLSNGKPPVRSRSAIREAYAKSGGSLFLSAYAYSVDGATGYIIGGFRSRESEPDGGKFVLALRKGADGRWLIAADMDNGNQRQRPPQPPPPAAPGSQ